MQLMGRYFCPRVLEFLMTSFTSNFVIIFLNKFLKKKLQQIIECFLKETPSVQSL